MERPQRPRVKQRRPLPACAQAMSVRVPTVWPAPSGMYRTGSRPVRRQPVRACWRTLRPLRSQPNKPWSCRRTRTGPECAPAKSNAWVHCGHDEACTATGHPSLQLCGCLIGDTEVVGHCCGNTRTRFSLAPPRRGGVDRSTRGGVHRSTLPHPPPRAPSFQRTARRHTQPTAHDSEARAARGEGAAERHCRSLDSDAVCPAVVDGVRRRRRRGQRLLQ